MGVVTDVLHYGQDLLVIRRPRRTARTASRLVPFVKAIVPEVDLGAGVIVIDPPPGLLDPAAGAIVAPPPVLIIKGEGVGLRIDIVTIFPDYFDSPLGVSLIGKAAARGDIEFRVHDLRRWATDVHHTVDDLPFGGGPGMVMKPDVWGDALDEIIGPDEAARLVVPTPSGVPFTQDAAARYAAQPRLVFACGRYEGIDGRVVDEMRTRMPVDEVSIGDYVLAGGEAAALVMVEAVGRLLPGVLGNACSAGDDSFGGDGAGQRHARAARGTGLHQAAGLARARGARGPAVRQPCRDHALAARYGAAPDRRSPGGPDRGAARPGPA